MPDSQRGAVVEAASLVEMLRLRGVQSGHDVAYRFLEDDGQPQASLTWSELETRARALAARLQSLELAGERVLLLYPPGLDYVVAFFGCLFAGAVAVPAYPPHPRRPMPRIEAIVADCQPRAALTTAATLAGLRARIDELSALRLLQWLASDALDTDVTAAAEDWTDPAVGPQSLAFLQYTSGSTGNPKGVMVSHGNLLHNLESIRTGFRMPERPVVITWLPMYHDMGLIGCIIEPMHLGAATTLMSPASFLQRPALWLESISRYRGVVAGAPNFAYDLCAERVTPEQRARLDLSSWQVAFCGAEPVRRRTLQRFAEVFAPCGFRRDAFYPCYGLAESTLIVSGGAGPGPIETLTIDKPSLEKGVVRPVDSNHPQAHELVSCGRALGEQEIAIVDPETLCRAASSRVGEVWVSGGSVAGGYWNRPELSESQFRARQADTDEGPFLRTGDLGFIHDGELYITGRLKDLIIIRGQNHYPQDIERTVDEAHPSLRAGGGAAFSVERDGQERLVVVHEVRREALRAVAAGGETAVGDIVDAVRRHVAEQHQLAVDTVVLLQPGALPKTSSGKTQRRASRADFLAGRLNAVAAKTTAAAAASPADAPDGSESAAPPASLTAAEAERWLVAWLVRKLPAEPGSIDVSRPLAAYGLDSLAALELVQHVDEQLGRKLDPANLWEFTTLRALADHLGDRAVDEASLLTALPEPCRAAIPTRRRWWPLPRWDGEPVLGEEPARQIQPYIMPRRSDCLAYFDATYDISRTLPWLAAFNRANPVRPATFFDLFLWALAYTNHVRPGLNRFVSGGRVYQRNHVAISFMAKKTFELTSPFTTIRVEFPPGDSLASSTARVAAAVAAGRTGPPRGVDRELAILTRLPGPIVRLAVWAFRLLDRWNLLPAAFTRNDPMYVSAFVSNLGSVGLDAAYHHLFEIGTCSVFAAVGMAKPTTFAGTAGRLEVRDSVNVKWTVDTRIVDGLYAASCLQFVRTLIENVDRHLGPPEAAARGGVRQDAS